MINYNINNTLPLLRPVQHDVVGYYAGHHGFADGDRADADAGVMAAFGDDLGFLAMPINGSARGQNRGGGLDRKTTDNFLARADAAQYATGMI